MSAHFRENDKENPDRLSGVCDLQYEATNTGPRTLLDFSKHFTQFPFTLKRPSLFSSPLLSNKKRGRKIISRGAMPKSFQMKADIHLVSFCPTAPSLSPHVSASCWFREVFDVKIWNSQEYVGSKCSLVRYVSILHITLNLWCNPFLPSWWHP